MLKRLSSKIVLLVSAALAAQAADDLTLHPKIEKIDLRAPGRVLMLNDGRLAVAGKGQIMASADDGKTWQVQGQISAGAGPAVSGGMLVEDRNGALVLIYRDDAGMKFERTKDNMPLPGAKLQIWCARSADGGKTWSDHQPLIEGFCGAFIGAICTRENTLVVPLQDLRYEPPRHVTIVCTSTDGGKTWRKSADLDIGGYGAEDGGFESTVTQRKDGSLLLYLRTTRDRLWQSESKDQGVTWSLATPTDLKSSNSPSYLLTLQSGRLALVWNPLHPEGKPDWPRRVKPRYAERPDSVYREELLFALSEDNGATWTTPEVIARQPGGKLRYAYMFERKPGEIWLAVRGLWLRIKESDFTH